jgi:hypothetical protein
MSEKLSRSKPLRDKLSVSLEKYKNNEDKKKNRDEILNWVHEFINSSDNEGKFKIFLHTGKNNAVLTSYFPKGIIISSMFIFSI